MITRHDLRSPLASGLLVLALAAGSAHAGSEPFAQYAVSGQRAGQPIAGQVRFALQSSAFQATLSPNPVAPGPVAPSPVARGEIYAFSGNRQELNLFVISFWSFEGFDNQAGSGSATGSGINLFFGLLTLGSLRDSNAADYSFIGGFGGVVNACPPSPVGNPAAHPAAAGLLERATPAPVDPARAFSRVRPLPARPTAVDPRRTPPRQTTG